MNTLFRGYLIFVVFIVWTLLAVDFAIHDYYTERVSIGQSFWATLVVWLTRGYQWMLITPLVFLISQRYFVKSGQLWRNLLIHFFAGSALSLIHLTIFIFAQRWLLGSAYTAPPSFSADLQKNFVGEIHINLLIYSIIAGFWHLVLFNIRYRDRERETARLAISTAQIEKQLANAQLDALKMQLHPHFLFNALHSVSAHVREPEIVRTMLARIGDFLRMTLDNSGAQEITLKEELDFLRCYLEIEQTRFRDRLSIEIDIDAETWDAQVPNMILQPLIENAVKHGIEPHSRPGFIEIYACRVDEYLHLEIRDNGCGLKVEGNAVANFMNGDGPILGTGLKTTLARLVQMYPGEHDLQYCNAPRGGLIVTLNIPFKVATR
ncbi:MAG: sensor histidine kinase [Pyrinomonadaceae bacterium]